MSRLSQEFLLGAAAALGIMTVVVFIWSSIMQAQSTKKFPDLHRESQSDFESDDDFEKHREQVLDVFEKIIGAKTLTYISSFTAMVVSLILLFLSARAIFGG